jgi:hypothetical protein
VFDGNSNTISNFNYSVYYPDPIVVGIFGSVDDVNAMIMDLGIVEPNIYYFGTHDYGPYVGTLLGGLVNGTVFRCWSAGGSVKYNESFPYGIHVGGLVGVSAGNIINCYSSNVLLDNKVENLGGLLGGNYYGTVTNCYSICNISGDSKFAGGLIGENDNGEVFHS